MIRIVLFIVLAIAFILSGWASGGSNGISSTCINDDCVHSASTSLISVLISVFLLFLIILFPQYDYRPDSSRTVGVWRRCGALFLDFALFLLISAPFAALPILISEMTYTGTFSWAFQRDFSRPTDTAFILPVIFCGFLALYFYFYIHLSVSRPTVGLYILGYRVEPANNQQTPKYALRVVMSYIGLCMWPISVIFALRNTDKAFWWDSATGTRVFRISAHKTGKNISFSRGE